VDTTQRLASWRLCAAWDPVLSGGTGPTLPAALPPEGAPAGTDPAFSLWFTLKATQTRGRTWDAQEYTLIALHRSLLYPKPVLSTRHCGPRPAARRCQELVPRVSIAAAKRGEQALGSPPSPAPRTHHQPMGKTNPAQKEAAGNREGIPEGYIANHPQNNAAFPLTRVFTA